MQHVPIVTMHSVKDVPVDQPRCEGRGRGSWALTREYRVSIATRSTRVKRWLKDSGTAALEEIRPISHSSAALPVTRRHDRGFPVFMQGVLVPVVGSHAKWIAAQVNFLLSFRWAYWKQHRVHVLVTRFGQSEQLAQLQRRSIARYPNVYYRPRPDQRSTHLGQGLFVVQLLALFSIATACLFS